MNKLMKMLEGSVTLKILFYQKCIWTQTFIPFKKCYRGFLKIMILKSNFYHFNIVSVGTSVMINDMKNDDFEIAGKMFIYVNHCPWPMSSWIQFFKDFINKESLDQLVLFLNRIVHTDFAEDHRKNFQKISKKLLDQLSTKLNLKYPLLQKLNGQQSNSSHDDIINEEGTILEDYLFIIWLMN